MASLIEEAAQLRQFDRLRTQKSSPAAWVTFIQVANGRRPRQLPPIKGWSILPFFGAERFTSLFLRSPIRVLGAIISSRDYAALHTTF